MKTRILWCDRNASEFVECFKNYTSYEIFPCDSIENARKLFETENFSLVISGYTIKSEKDGIKLNNLLNLPALKINFLLLTGESLPSILPERLLENFFFIAKDELRPDNFENIINSLLNRTVETDIKLRLQNLRMTLGYSLNQFAQLIDTPIERVSKYENSEFVPASYILNICNSFNIPLEIFLTSTEAEFKKILRSKSQLRRIASEK